MDKNKALYKLKGLPPIYYLNLDAEPERNIFMETQLEYWGIENYTRISAYDGRGDRDLSEIIKGRYPDGMTSGEVGCTTSHLKALRHFLETSDSPCALIENLYHPSPTNSYIHIGLSGLKYITPFSPCSNL